MRIVPALADETMDTIMSHDVATCVSDRNRAADPARPRHADTGPARWTIALSKLAHLKLLYFVETRARKVWAHATTHTDLRPCTNAKTETQRLSRRGVPHRDVKDERAAHRTTRHTRDHDIDNPRRAARMSFAHSQHAAIIHSLGHSLTLYSIRHRHVGLATGKHTLAVQTLSSSQTKGEGGGQTLTRGRRRHGTVSRHSLLPNGRRRGFRRESSPHH